MYRLMIISLLILLPSTALAQSPYWTAKALSGWEVHNGTNKASINVAYPLVEFEEIGGQSGDTIADVIASRNVTAVRFKTTGAVLNAINSDPDYIVVYARKHIWQTYEAPTYECVGGIGATQEDCEIDGGVWTMTDPGKEEGYIVDPANDTMETTASGPWKLQVKNWLQDRNVSNAKLIKWFYRCTEDPALTQTECGAAGFTWEDPDETYLYYSDRLKELVKRILE